MRIVDLQEIKEALEGIDIIPSIEAGFVAYSQGKSVVPPPGELVFDDPYGVVHLKYGYLKGEKYYVIKIASGFYDNPGSSVATNSGMMLLCSQKNGLPLALLQDKAVLTDLRTGAAGAIAAKYLAPAQVTRIGVLGAGVQGRLQVEFLHHVTPCRDVIVWGVDDRELAAYQEDLSAKGYNVDTTREAAAVGEICNLIVTCTPSHQALLQREHIRPGTHITAVGADTLGKQELDVGIVTSADLLVADSISQVIERGECQHAFGAGLIAESDLVELGQVISGEAPGRTDQEQITIADLTGVAVQDLKIAEAVYEAINA